MKSVSKLSESRWGFFLFLALLAALLLGLSGKGCAQVDIQLPRSNGQYLILAKAAQWNVSGGSGDCTKSQCGINNSYIFPALYTQETVTVLVFNNSATTNETGVTLTAAVAIDPSVSQFQGNTAKWSGSSFGGFNIGGTPVSINLNGGAINGLTSVSATFQVTGASRIVLTFGGGVTAGDTLGADIVVIQSQLFTAPASIVQSFIGTPINGLFPRNTAASSLASLNPVVAGCFMGPAAGTSGRNQFVNCDTSGNLFASAVLGGVAVSAANPLPTSPTVSGVAVSASNPLPITFSATGALDPCQDAGVAKSSIFKDITTATTTAVITSSASTAIYVCGYEINMTASAASADTVQLEDGTGAACVTTQVTKTPNYSSGLLSAGATQVNVGFGSMTVFQTVAGGELCAVSTVGTTPKISLMVTYVQQ